MKRIPVLLLAVLAAACGPATRPLERSQRRLAAVLPFAYQASESKYSDIVEGLADSFTASLLQTGRIRMVERSQVEKVMAEASYQRSGAVDVAKAVEVGRQLGADSVLIGSVSGVSTREEGRSVKFAEKTTRWATVAAEVRLVDVKTGELLAAGRAAGEASGAEKHAFGGKIGQIPEWDALVTQALIPLADKLAQQLAKTIPPL